VTSRALALALFAVALGALVRVPAARAQDALLPERDRPLLGAPSRRGELADEPSALPLPDEQKIERARNLVRTGYAAQAQTLVDDVAQRHPDDLDVLLAKVELLSRTSDGATVTRFFDAAAGRAGVARQLAARPRRAGVWHRYHAEALFATGRPADATRAVLAAWEASPEQAAWARIRLDDARAADAAAVTGAAAELRKVADRHPERDDLALAAAQQEARSGQMKSALKRMQKLDGANPDDKRGAALWRFGLSFLERGEGEVALADSAFAALALDGAADPALRRQATDRLFDDVGGSDAPPTPTSPLPMGTQNSTVTRLTIDAQGHLVVDHTGVGDVFKDIGRPSPADAGQVNRAGSLAALERIWHGLPPSRETVRRGLDLAERMRAAGDPAGAARVEAAASKMAAAFPGGATATGTGDTAPAEGNDVDPELDGRLALRAGESALTAGDLDKAAEAFGKVAASNASDRVKEQAEFERCETAFYAGRFDSAAAGYDRFARAHPAGPFTNDALERAYLIESGEGGSVPGLSELARAMRMARDGAGDDVIAAATAAEKASANGPAWAESELLLANLLEARGLKADAAAKAVGMAEAKPDDRLAPTARKKAGDLYHAMGQDALALAQYDTLLTRYPRSWLAPETRRVANQLRARAGTNP